MRKRILGAGLGVLLAVTSLSSVGRAEAPQPAVAMAEPLQTTTDSLPVNLSRLEQPMQAIQTELQRLSGLPEFQDWKQGQVVPVRYLYDPSGEKTAILWQVSQDKEQSIGYLVSTLDGRGIYEFSHGPVPTLQAALLPKRKNQGYIYAGPMLHLVYLQEGGRVELYNLLTGERLPPGELLNHVPVLPTQGTDIPQQTPHEQKLRIQPVQASASPTDDALYATGLFGLHKSEPQPAVQQLEQYAEGYTFSRPAFVVYEAIQDHYTVTLAVTQMLQVGEQYFLGVADPFAPPKEQKAAVYIDSRFPVAAVETNASSVTNKSAK